MIVLLILLLSLLIASLSSVPNIFEANFDNPIVFNRKVSNTAILLKPWIKR